MEVRFVIDSDTHLSIPFQDHISEFDEAPVNLVHKGKIKYVVCGNYDSSVSSLLIDTWCALIDFKRQLEDVLAEKLQCPQDWHDLGKIWNEHIQKEREYELIESFVLWRPSGLPSTLLYNQNGNIILEIVPLYHQPIHQVPYHEFLSNITMSTRYVIPRKTAEEWLQRTISLLETMEQNKPQN